MLKFELSSLDFFTGSVERLLLEFALLMFMLRLGRGLGFDIVFVLAFVLEMVLVLMFVLRLVFVLRLLSVLVIGDKLLLSLFVL